MDAEACAQPAREVIAKQGGNPIERHLAKYFAQHQGIRLVRGPRRGGDEVRQDPPCIGFRRVAAACADKHLANEIRGTAPNFSM